MLTSNLITRQVYCRLKSEYPALLDAIRDEARCIREERAVELLCKLEQSNIDESVMPEELALIVIESKLRELVEEDVRHSLPSFLESDDNSLVDLLVLSGMQQIDFDTLSQAVLNDEYSIRADADTLAIV